MSGDRTPGNGRPRLSRRSFLTLSAAAVIGSPEARAAVLGVEGRVRLHRGADSGGAFRAAGAERFPLRAAPVVTPAGVVLTAAPGSADIGGGAVAQGWLINGSLPSPLLRVRRGAEFSATLRNRLDEPLILHWHGLTPPESEDGHPRLAVRPGEEYRYRFPVQNRAGTYWYHSHAHHRVAYHTQMGIAGMLIVNDEEEDALGLPGGDREIPLIIQDRKLGADGLPHYHDPDLMEGHTGEAPFGNGVLRPYREVDNALYRIRILNGANARIFRLTRSDGRDLIVIGNDGGLLGAPVRVAAADISPGERLDVLMDLRGLRVGERVMLRSIPFGIGGHIAEIARANVYDLSLDLLELRVAREVNDPSRIPARLVEPKLPNPDYVVRERTFRFTFSRDVWTRSMETHSINGTSFDMNRVDAVVPFGETEVWHFVNDGWFAHPVHLHGTHFRVLSRSGGRSQVFPWEGGLKDTVLIYPDESVSVAVCFTAHRGLFLMHCHNLEHEDAGMMLNVLVE